MKKSGLADSPFFALPQKKGASPPLLDRPPAEKKGEKKESQTEKSDSTKGPSSHDTTTPSNRDTVTPRYHDAAIEQIRKAVKEFGKEAATHRFTAEEKKAIADIIYAYKNRGIRTNENEITRIAVNFLINDYREDGDNSLLEKALRALNE